MAYFSIGFSIPKIIYRYVIAQDSKGMYALSFAYP